MKQEVASVGIPGVFPGFCRQECSDCQIEDRSDYPLFTQIFLNDGECSECLQNESSHILFMLRGSVELESREANRIRLSAGQCYFYTRDKLTRMTGEGTCHIVRLDFVRRMVLCGRDCLCNLGRKHDFAALVPAPPVLTINPLIRDALTVLFEMPQLMAKPCFHYLKTASLFMMMSTLYSSQELVNFFLPIIRTQDDFRAFVISNYKYMRTVAEFAEAASMSKRVFEKKFAEVFNDSVSHWLTQRKARDIVLAIRYGMTSVKEIKKNFGFSTDASLTRFSKAHLGDTPARVIEALSQENSGN